MTDLLRTEALAESVRRRRESSGMSIRQAGNAAGVSPATVTRIESGEHPDLATFLRLCAWLQERPEQFFADGPRRRADTPDVVAVHLMADPRLDGEAAASIVSVVRAMYAAMASEASAHEPVAAHLCAEAALLPGVAERLGGLLSSMRGRLLAEAAR